MSKKSSKVEKIRRSVFSKNWGPEGRNEDVKRKEEEGRGPKSRSSQKSKICSTVLLYKSNLDIITNTGTLGKNRQMYSSVEVVPIDRPRWIENICTHRCKINSKFCCRNKQQVMHRNKWATVHALPH